MSDSSRRGFLKYAGAGAAAVGAAAVIPSVVSHTSSSGETHDVALPATAAGSLVAYVTDVHSGTVSLMVEGHEVSVTDHQLVARLAHAMHTARSTTL